MMTGFQELKNKLTSTPKLVFLKGTEVYFDASEVGLECLLMQHGKVVLRPKTVVSIWEELPIHDFELAAIIFTLKL